MKRIWKSILLLITIGSALQTSIAQDSTSGKNRAWKRVTYQMRQFNKAVSGYISAIDKAKPGDTTLTDDVKTYSDSVDHMLAVNKKPDSTSLRKIQVVFDSLLKSTVKLVRKVEEDTTLRNNKTVKNLTKMVNTARHKVIDYTQDVNNSRKKKKADNAKKEEETLPEEKKN